MLLNHGHERARAGVDLVLELTVRERAKLLAIGRVPVAVDHRHSAAINLRGKRARPISLLACLGRGLHHVAGQVLDERIGLPHAGLSRVLRNRDADPLAIEVRGLKDQLADDVRLASGANHMPHHILAVASAADLDPATVGAALLLRGGQVPAAIPENDIARVIPLAQLEAGEHVALVGDRVLLKERRPIAREGAVAADALKRWNGEPLWPQRLAWLSPERIVQPIV